MTTNVADEREFYTFHQAASWLSTVHWRIRAVRDDFNKRAERPADRDARRLEPGLQLRQPAVHRRAAEARSRRCRTSSRPGASSSPAQRLMPAFVYSGNQSFLALSQRALPRLRLHRPRLPEPRLHGRDRRQPGLRAARERPARAAPGDGQPSQPPRARLPARRLGRHELHVGRRAGDRERVASPP